MPLDKSGITLGKLITIELNPTIPSYDNSNGYLSPSQVAATNANSALAKGPTLIYWTDFSQVICTYLVDNLNVVDNVAVSGVPTVGQVLTATSPTTANWQNGGSSGSFSAGLDLSGTSSSQEVIGILGSPLPPLSDGYLNYNGSSWQFSSLSSSSGITTLTGDVSATGSGSVSAEVTGILNKSLPSLPVSDGYLNYTGSAWVFSPITIPTTLPPNGSAGGDLSGTYPNPTVASLTGASGTILIASTGNILTWNKATTAPGLAQTILTTDVAPANMTIAAQSAELAASTNKTGGSLILLAGAPATTNGTSGNVVAALAAPTGSGSEAFLQVKRGSSSIASIGAMPGTSGADTALYLLPSGGTPGITNCVIDSYATGVIFNDANTGQSALGIGDGAVLLVNNKGLSNIASLSSSYNLGTQGMTVANFGGTVGAIGLATVTTAPTGNVTGSVLYTASDGYLRVITTGTSTPQLLVGAGGVDVMTGYNLYVNSANATTSSTLVGGIIMAKATTNPSNSVTNAQMYADSSTGNISFFPPSSTAYAMNVGGTNINLNGVNLLWTATTGNASLGFANTAVNSATGYNTTISAQNATGTTTIGGNLLLSSGSGTTSSGTTSLQGAGASLLTVGLTGLGLGQSSFAKVTPTLTPSAAQYKNPVLHITGTITAAMLIALPSAPAGTLWIIDLSAALITGGPFNITFTVGGGSASSAISYTAAGTPNLIFVVSTGATGIPAVK